jgi:hypothetical protein
MKCPPTVRASLPRTVMQTQLMNLSRPSTSPIGGRTTGTNDKPWRRTRFEPADSIGQPLDPAAPRALWRLVNIGEMAGLLTTSDQDATIEVFRAGGPKRAAVDAELDRFKCSLMDLYVLVTLFSAAPRPVSLPVLARETYADSLSLRKSLDHLDELDAISAEGFAGTGSALQLTSSGWSLAVFLIYRVINACI